MKLDKYLKARWKAAEESVNAFARRATVPQQTVNDIAGGAGCNLSTAYLIVTASKDQPVEGKQYVTFEDLVSDDTKRAAEDARRAYRAELQKKAREAIRRLRAAGLDTSVSA